MGFIMAGLDAEDYDRHYSDRELLKRITGYFRPALGPMVVVAVMILLNSAASMVQPVLGSWGIDRIINEGARSAIWILFFGFLAAGVLAWIFNYIAQWLTATVVSNVVLKLRQDAFSAVMDRDLSFFDTNPSGRVVSRVTSDTDDFSTVITLTMNLLSQFLLVGIITAVLFTRNVTLAFVAISITPVFVIMAIAFRKIARDSTQQAQRSTAVVNSSIQETMNGIAIAKNFRQERRLYDEFEPVNDQAYKVTLKQGLVFSAIFPLLFFVAGLGTVLLVYLGGRGLISGDISAGDWFLFFQSVKLFWMPMTSIASFWSQFQRGLGASERIFALIDTEPEVVQTADDDPGRIRGEIEFRDLTFGYEDYTKVLLDFNLTIPAGETLAIVGHTGAGKSTLGKLITRFYEFQSGELLIDGKSVRRFDLPEYRRQLGIVPQSPFLFSGTVADNIRYPKPDATDAEVLKAAQAVGQGDWVELLPEGLETVVGEYGRSLSMGQRQLVALARILIQDPAIVILDEATASVDPLTEAQIQEGLDVVLADRTSIVIAHRLSTIEHADRIIVLDHGDVVEEGTHASLMAKGGRYCDVYNTYFRHQSPNYVPGKGFVPAAGVA
ncbi:MAG: ABC transporter ATP-binding protein/permease [Chloroflexota bacterium]|nr:ABC transporter ATP-binding protein/permease [Chloroflexota bacterium]